MDYGVITFTSTYGAIYAQKVLRPVADVLTMPVLREISLGCGIAVRFRPEDGAAVRAALAASQRVGLSSRALMSSTTPATRSNQGSRPMSSRKGRPTRNRMTGMRITAARQMMPSVNSVTMESVLLLMVPAYHTQIKAS